MRHFRSGGVKQIDVGVADEAGQRERERAAARRYEFVIIVWVRRSDVIGEGRGSSGDGYRGGRGQRVAGEIRAGGHEVESARGGKAGEAVARRVPDHARGDV